EVGNDSSVALVFQKHWEGLLLLVVSMFAVVGSWEGYLKSIRQKPLDDEIRFYLDIFIVFAYLILMLSSELTDLWYWSLFLTFVIYLAWDVAGIVYVRKHPEVDANKRLDKQSIVITAIWAYASLILLLCKNVATPGGFRMSALA